MLHFRETWLNRNTAALHRGKVGSKGKYSFNWLKSENMPNMPTAEEFFQAFRAEAAADGYAEIPDEDHAWAVLQVYTHSDDLTHPQDQRLRFEAVDALSEFLGWRGLGHCDGFDVGGETPTGTGTRFNLFCVVVDAETAVKVLRRFARDFGIDQGYVIATRQPGIHSEYVLAWSADKRNQVFGLD